MSHPSDYEDIINLPHHISPTRPRMAMIDRAAQFSPFAALTGHAAAVRETARVTEAQMELTEDSRALLDEKLRMLIELLPSEPEATITWFEPDERKDGGAYIEVTGRVKKIDANQRTVTLANGAAIPMDRIVEIEAEIFRHSDIDNGRRQST